MYTINRAVPRDWQRQQGAHRGNGGIRRYTIALDFFWKNYAFRVQGANQGFFFEKKKALFSVSKEPTRIVLKRDLFSASKEPTRGSLKTKMCFPCPKSLPGGLFWKNLCFPCPKSLPSGLFLKRTVLSVSREPTRGSFLKNNFVFRFQRASQGSFLKNTILFNEY